MLYAVAIALLLIVPQYSSAATAGAMVDGAKKEGKLIVYHRDAARGFDQADRAVS